MILVVEDSPDDAELVLRALRAGPADDAELARDGKQALDLLFGNDVGSDRGPRRPDVILLDLKLPKVPGLDVLRAIKSNPTTRHIPVIVFSSSDEPADIARAYELGANSYIQKPLTFAGLSDAIATVRSYWLKLNMAMPEQYRGS